MLDAILEWYFDEDYVTKPYIVRLLRLFVLYPIVFILSCIFLFFVFLFRIFNTYILKRDVSTTMGGIAYAMLHIMAQPNL